MFHVKDHEKDDLWKLSGYEIYASTNGDIDLMKYPNHFEACQNFEDFPWERQTVEIKADLYSALDKAIEDWKRLEV